MSEVKQAEGSGGRDLAERGRLLLALYEGALGFLRHAIAAHEQGNFARFVEGLDRAERVVRELRETLDYEQSRDLATMLGQLYEFMITQLHEAKETNDASIVRQEMERLGQIYDAYRQVIAGLPADPA